MLIEASLDDAKEIMQAMTYGEPLYNFKIVQKDSLTEGINFLKTAKVDVILLDLNMPDAKEHEAIEVIHGLFPELPIVVMSNTSNIETAHQAFKSGAQECLNKEECNSTTLRQSIYQALYRKKVDLSYQRGEKL